MIASAILHFAEDGGAHQGETRARGCAGSRIEEELGLDPGGVEGNAVAGLALDSDVFLVFEDAVEKFLSPDLVLVQGWADAAIETQHEIFTTLVQQAQGMEVPVAGGVHLGIADFLEQFEQFETHVQAPASIEYKECRARRCRSREDPVGIL